MKHTVSTIIPVYNRPIFLRQAVASVLAQTHRPIEIIIVDDASTDDTPRVVAELVASHADEVRALHVPNGGAGLAREAGRREARGDFIQYLDSDDLLMPRKFEVQVAALQANPDCGIAYGITRLIDESGNVLQSPYKWTGRAIDTLFPSLLVDRWWNTHTPLYRREVCDAVGPWPDMRTSEDWEYESRVGALGVKLVHTPECLSDTRSHTGARLTGGAMDAEQVRTQCRLLKALHLGATAANVPLDCSEMRHFARWAFATARQAGRFGMTNEARACFDIAVASSVPARRASFQFRLWRLGVSLMGWRCAGRLAEGAVRAVRRRPSDETLKQSWMTQA